MPPFAEPSSFVSATPGHADGVVEEARLLQAVLAGRRVDDEQHLVRRAFAPAGDHAAHLGELVHQVRLRVQAAGGVDQHDPVLGADGVVGDGRRVAAALAADERRVRALGPDLELLLGGGAERVGGADASLAAALAQRLASLPIVVVLPVPLTPTTRITAGSWCDVERRRLAEQRGDLLGERGLQLGQVLARLEPADQLGRRAHADVGVDQRLLEPLPRRVVLGSNAATCSCSVSARRDLPSDSRSRPKMPRRSSALSSSAAASPSSSAQLLAIARVRVAARLWTTMSHF